MRNVDISAIGVSYQSEADKAFSKALAFAVILMMAHFLEIKPSEMDAFGLKVSFSDPALLYGAIAMVFGYYASRALRLSEDGGSLLQINVRPHRMRSNIRASRRIWKSKKRNKGKPIDHLAIKGEARDILKISNILVAPYHFFAVVFIVIAVPTSLHDLYRLGEHIVERQLLDK